MGRSVYFFILVSMLGLLLVFQNCANPAPYASRPGVTTNSSAGSVEPPVFLTPRDGRERGVDPALPIGSAPPVLAMVQRSGTSQDERAHSLMQTADGGFILTGLTQDDPEYNRGREVLFKKFTETGEHAYSVRVGDTFEQSGFRTIETLDAYLIAGSTRTVLEDDENQLADGMMMRLRKSDGRVLDVFRYGLPGYVEIIYDLVRTADGSGETGIVAVGFTTKKNSDGDEVGKSAMILKFNENLELIWQRKLDFRNEDSGNWDKLVLRSVAYVPGKGYYAVGSRQLNEKDDAFIVNFSFAGEIKGARMVTEYGGDNKFYDVAHTGTDVVVVGFTRGNSRNGDGSIYHFNYNLGLKSIKTIGSNTETDYAVDVNIARDLGLVIAGTSNDTSGGDYDNFVVKINADDSIEYLNFVGTGGNDANQFHSLLVRKDGGLAFLSSEDNPNRSGTLSPKLYLFDQYGDLGPQCQSHFRSNPRFTPQGDEELAPFSVKVEEGNKYKPTAINLTVSTMTMERESLDDFESTEFEPGQKLICEN